MNFEMLWDEFRLILKIQHCFKIIQNDFLNVFRLIRIFLKSKQSQIDLKSKLFGIDFKSELLVNWRDWSEKNSQTGETKKSA